MPNFDQVLSRVLCPGCQLPMSLTGSEEATLGLSKLTYQCEKCSAVTQRILKVEASQAVFIAAMRSQATKTSTTVSKIKTQMTETVAGTREVIGQSRDMLDKLESPENSSAAIPSE